MKATFYTVVMDGPQAIEGEAAAPTLSAAKFLRSQTEHPYGEIRRVHVNMPLRALLVGVFNREHYAESSEIVVPAK